MDNRFKRIIEFKNKKAQAENQDMQQENYL